MSIADLEHGAPQTVSDQLRSRLAASDALSMQLQHALMDGHSQLHTAAGAEDRLPGTPTEPADGFLSPGQGASLQSAQAGSVGAALGSAACLLADITNAAAAESPSKRGILAKQALDVGTGACREAGPEGQVRTARAVVMQLDGTDAKLSSPRMQLEEWKQRSEGLAGEVFRLQGELCAAQESGHALSVQLRRATEKCSQLQLARESVVAAVGSVRGQLETTAALQLACQRGEAAKAVVLLETALQKELRAKAHFEGLLGARDTECAQLQQQSSRHEAAARQLLQLLEGKQAAHVDQHAELESLYRDNKSLLASVESLVRTLGERDATIQSLTAEMSQIPEVCLPPPPLPPTPCPAGCTPFQAGTTRAL